jgi:hypothetical protein
VAEEPDYTSIGGLTAQLNGKLGTSTRGAANGVAPLDGNSKVPVVNLPGLAINNVFPVASQAAMLALTAVVGDMAIRSDVSKTFVLAALPTSTLGNWLEVSNPTGGVASFNGRTGSVTPEIGDYSVSQISGITTVGNNFITAADATAQKVLLTLAGLSTSEANAVLNTIVMQAIHSLTNAHINLQPKGTGGLYLGPAADGTATGGNARGAGAVDLQLGKSSSQHVASGANSFAAGRSNLVSGADSAAVGSFLAISSFYTWATGRQGSDRSINCSRIHASGANSAAGERQIRDLILAGTTTDAATAVTLVSDTGSAAVTNQLVLPNNSTYLATFRIAGHQTSGTPAAAAGCCDYEIKATLSRRASASTVAVIASSLTTHSNGLGVATVPSLVADTTNGLIQVRVQGVASTTIRWVAHATTVEVVS